MGAKRAVRGSHAHTPMTHTYTMRVGSLCCRLRFRRCIDCRAVPVRTPLSAPPAPSPPLPSPPLTHLPDSGRLHDAGCVSVPEPGVERHRSLARRPRREGPGGGARGEEEEGRGGERGANQLIVFRLHRRLRRRLPCAPTSETSLPHSTSGAGKGDVDAKAQGLPALSLSHLACCRWPT